MITVVSIKPLLAVFVSMLVTVLLMISKRPNVREFWTFAAAGAKFVIVASMVPVVLRGIYPEFTVLQVLPDIGVKFRVDVEGGKGYARAKAWPRDEAEPDAWTIEAVDPQPNLEGSAGIYAYSMAPVYFDNVRIYR